MCTFKVSYTCAWYPRSQMFWICSSNFAPPPRSSWGGGGKKFIGSEVAKNYNYNQMWIYSSHFASPPPKIYFYVYALEIHLALVSSYNVARFTLEEKMADSFFQIWTENRKNEKLIDWSWWEKEIFFFKLSTLTLVAHFNISLVSCGD